jgi:hypothetical protein
VIVSNVQQNPNRKIVKFLNPITDHAMHASASYPLSWCASVLLAGMRHASLILTKHVKQACSSPLVNRHAYYPDYRTVKTLSFSHPIAASSAELAVPRFPIILYFFRSILSFINMNISKYILVLDTFVFVKGNMGRRKYINIL